MQITLNSIVFDVTAVDEPLRAALLSDPQVAAAAARDVWAWDGAEGRFLAPVTKGGAVPLPPALTLFVPRAGLAGDAPRRADGPTTRMAERLLAAVGAKSLSQVMQALARVTGIPQIKVPLATFGDRNGEGAYGLRMDVDYAAVQLANAARNLSMYALLPALVVFVARPDGAAEDAPAPRPGFVLPPPTQAALAMRRMAAARRLTDLQASLGGVKPAELDPADPRRDAAARLGAEWRALSPKPKAA